MRYRLSTLLLLLAIGPPAVGVLWAIQSQAASHRMPELALILAALLTFLALFYPLTIAAAWTVDTTAALLALRHKQR